MTYYGAKDMAASFRTVRQNTITIAEEIGEQHYGFSGAPNTRTVSQTLAHMALATRMTLELQGTQRLTSFEGFDFAGFFTKLAAEEKAPRNKEQLITLLREEGDRFASWLESLSEEFLSEQVIMRAGMTPLGKSRFEMILGVKEHEMHHRSQLMLMERMLGIVPHLTRQMEARMAEMLAANKAAGR